MINILPIHTTCRGCCFAEYKNKLQTGCTLDLIDKYRHQAVEIVEAYDENDENFYIVNGRLCLFKRDARWYDNAQFPFNQIRIERAPKIEYLIYLGEKDIQHLESTLHSIETQAIKPISIRIINNGQYESSILHERLNKTGVPWSIQDILEDDADMERCVDIVIRNCKSNYFMVCNAGFVLDADFTTKLDEMLNVNLQQILFIDMGPQCYFSRLMMYKTLLGNRGKLYREKIQEYVDEHNIQQTYYRWEECSLQP